MANMVLGTASASAATQTISSPTGPLTRIVISDQLNCQVNHASDKFNEFWPPTGSIGACTTQIAVGGQLYGPADIPNGNDPTPFTPVSQSPVTGAGIPGNPFQIVTVVDVGTTGLRITQTDSYVLGQENYRTDVKVENSGGATQNVVLYRAGDCYLQDSDLGFGKAIRATGEVACVGPEDPTDPSRGPGSRIEQWTPISPGSTYLEAQFSQVWDYIDTMTPFPNTCRCGDFLDNGAGLSWTFPVPAEGNKTRKHLTTFAPLGVERDVCSDGDDNDQDGNTDYPDDQGCSSLEDSSESPDPPECSDRLDNDEDGATNFPDDRGCSSAEDDSESPDPPPPPSRCTIRGTSGNDVIRGTPGDDVICAGAGNDAVYGGGGDDVISGGDGNDVLRGGEGNDRLTGGDGRDDLRGGDGTDRLSGGNGNDVLRGGDGDDRLVGGPGRDLLYGQEGRDFLDTRDNGGGNDGAHGGTGDDDCETDRGDARTSC